MKSWCRSCFSGSVFFWSKPFLVRLFLSGVFLGLPSFVWVSTYVLYAERSRDSLSSAVFLTEWSELSVRRHARSRSRLCGGSDDSEETGLGLLEQFLLYYV